MRLGLLLCLVLALQACGHLEPEECGDVAWHPEGERWPDELDAGTP